MAAISLSYLTSAVNARAFLRFLLSSRATRIRYRLTSTLTRCGVAVPRAAICARPLRGVGEDVRGYEKALPCPAGALCRQ